MGLLIIGVEFGGFVIGWLVLGVDLLLVWWFYSLLIVCLLFVCLGLVLGFDVSVFAFVGFGLLLIL